MYNIYKFLNSYLSKKNKFDFVYILIILQNMETILTNYGLGRYIDVCHQEQIDLSVISIFGELYSEKEINMHDIDLETLKLFGELTPTNRSLGTIEFHIRQLGVQITDFSKWIQMTREVHANFEY